MMGQGGTADRSLALDFLTTAANGVFDRADVLIDWLLRDNAGAVAPGDLPINHRYG